MKIQPVKNYYDNGQNNLSHKAYFKPNSEFKKLWAYCDTKSNLEFKNKLNNVKYKLLDHELEILESGMMFDLNGEHKRFCTIFNNVTKKALGVSLAATSVIPLLEEVFDALLKKDEKTNSFFTELDSNTSNYENITTSCNIVEDSFFPQ